MIAIQAVANVNQFQFAKGLLPRENSFATSSFNSMSLTSITTTDSLLSPGEVLMSQMLTIPSYQCCLYLQ